MKKTTLLIPIIILLALSLSACGSSVERSLDSGNKAFGQQAYDQALEIYSQAMEMAPTLAEPAYNLANTLYRMEAFEQIAPLMGQALEFASEELAQHGFYNLGNSFFQQQQMDGAIESYKESLRINPDDIDAKYNLELAMQQQEEQQQDQNQSGEDQQEDDQSGSDQNEQDQNQEGQQEPQDQNQDGEEKQDDQGQSGEQQQEDDQQNPGQNGEQPPEEQEQNAQGQPQQLDGLTEEQARQILAAIGQSTETLQEKLQEIFGVPVAPSGKDW